MLNFSRSVASAFLVLALLAAACQRVDATPEPAQERVAEPSPAGVFSDEEIEVGKATRHFRLIVPNTVDRTKPASLVVAFHGMLIDKIGRASCREREEAGNDEGSMMT